MDIVSKKQRSYMMSKIKGKNTKPEILLRRHLWASGMRGYRVNAKILGKPDIWFPRKKLAIFVDGCFWHMCPLCYMEPKSNQRFWREKMRRNVLRDKEVTRRLQKQGITVLRIWEHSLNTQLPNITKSILRNLKK